MATSNDSKVEREMSDILEALREAKAALAPFAARLREVLVAAGPHLQAFAALAVQAQERFAHWNQHAPLILKGAVRAEGLIVPVSQLVPGSR